MKIFVDTNVFLDLILKRDGFEEALIILNSCNKNLFNGYVADITLLNIDYIASKQIKEIKDFLKVVNESFNVVGADNQIFAKALMLDNTDLEDNIQYLCSLENDCELIITNDKEFYKGRVKVLSSKDFIYQYLNEKKS